MNELAVTESSDKQRLVDVATLTIARLSSILPSDASSAARVADMLSITANASPKIMQCTNASIADCVCKMLMHQLAPGGSRPQVYIIPSDNRRAGKTEARFQISYHGYKELAMRSGLYTSIKVQCIYRGDSFEYELADEGPPRHKVSLAAERTWDNLVGAYMIARRSDGQPPEVELMLKSEIEDVRDNYSEPWKRNKTGPWMQEPLRMAEKTVLIRGCKRLEIDDPYGAFVSSDPDGVPEIDVEHVTRRVGIVPERHDHIDQRNDINETCIDAETGEVVSETRKDDGAPLPKKSDQPTIDRRNT